MKLWPDESDLDAAYWEGKALEDAEKAERIRQYEESPEQADWDADELDPFDAHEEPPPYGLRYEDIDDGQGWC